MSLLLPAHCTSHLSVFAEGRGRTDGILACLRGPGFGSLSETGWLDCRFLFSQYVYGVHIKQGNSHFILQKLKVNQSHYRPEVPRGFQEIKVPRLRDNSPEWW